MNYSRQNMTAIQSVIHARDFDARKGKSVENFNGTKENIQSLRSMGIFYDEHPLSQVYEAAKNQRGAVVFDAVTLQVTQNTPSVPTPIQFLQYWPTGQVAVLTSIRQADKLMGYATLGRWEDQQVVQSVIEMTANPVVYLDNTDNVQASYQPSYNPRTIIRLQMGLTVSQLESKRAAAGMLDDAGWKRKAVAQGLEIARNSIAFNGFISGAGGTYGFLNAPELSAYTIVPAGAGSSTTWASKTALEIIQDLLTAFVALRNQTQGNVNPKTTPTTLAVPTNCIDWLSKTTEFGYTVNTWLEKDYPMCRVVDAPQLQLAYSNSNVFYLYGDMVSTENDPYSTDGGETWLAGGPTKLLLLGVQQKTDGFEERYSNATMGAMCKRPVNSTRYYGI